MHALCLVFTRQATSRSSSLIRPIDLFQCVKLFTDPFSKLSQAAKEFETELKKEPGEGGDEPPPATPTAVGDGLEKKGA